MTGATNCPLCAPKPDVDDATCPCQNGYMNEEGTFIPGSLVTAGQVLSRKDYERHNPCEICERDPSRCQRRKNLLATPKPRLLEGEELEDYIDFWISREGISYDILKRYLEVNAGEHAECKPGKRFKDVNGYTIRSKFRFNSGILRELQELTTIGRRMGPLTRKDFTRKAPLTNMPFTEFTRYLNRSSSSVPSPGRKSDSLHSDQSQQQLEEDRSQEPLQSPSVQQARSRHDTMHKDSRNEDLEPTTGARHTDLPIRSRHEQSSSDNSRHRSQRVDGSPQHQPRMDYRHSQEAVAADARSHPRHIQYDENDQPRFSRHDIISQDGAQDHASREQRSRQHDSSPIGETKYNHGRPASTDTEDERDVVIRSERVRSDSSQHGISYGDRHATPQYEQPQRRPSYDAPTSAYGILTTERRANRKETRDEDLSPAESKNVRFFVPSEGMDVVVLAFYLKLFVDSGAQITNMTRNGKAGFLITAIRAVTQQEIKDIMKDTKSWHSERTKNSSPMNYVNSDTAKQRQKKAGKSR